MKKNTAFLSEKKIEINAQKLKDCTYYLLELFNDFVIDVN